ncbi:MAG: hypothetical protein ABIH41_05865 [Nanoarchaeota archaeon]
MRPPLVFDERKELKLWELGSMDCDAFTALARCYIVQHVYEQLGALRPLSLALRPRGHFVAHPRALDYVILELLQKRERSFSKTPRFEDVGSKAIAGMMEQDPNLATSGDLPAYVHARYSITTLDVLMNEYQDLSPFSCDQAIHFSKSYYMAFQDAILTAFHLRHTPHDRATTSMPPTSQRRYLQEEISEGYHRIEPITSIRTRPLMQIDGHGSTHHICAASHTTWTEERWQVTNSIAVIDIKAGRTQVTKLDVSGFDRFLGAHLGGIIDYRFEDGYLDAYRATQTDRRDG